MKKPSYKIVHAEPVLDASIEPERMEVLKVVNILSKRGESANADRD